MRLWLNRRSAFVPTLVALRSNCGGEAMFSRCNSAADRLFRRADIPVIVHVFDYALRTAVRRGTCTKSVRRKCSNYVCLLLINKTFYVTSNILFSIYVYTFLKKKYIIINEYSYYFLWLPIVPKGTPRKSPLIRTISVFAIVLTL